MQRGRALLMDTALRKETEKREQRLAEPQKKTARAYS